MAALKLKGYENANTNFDRHSYHTEPFMMARPLPRLPAASLGACHILIITATCHHTHHH